MPVRCASFETQKGYGRVWLGWCSQPCLRPRGKRTHFGKALAAGVTLLEMRGHQREFPGVKRIIQKGSQCPFVITSCHVAVLYRSPLGRPIPSYVKANARSARTNSVPTEPGATCSAAAISA